MEVDTDDDKRTLCVGMTTMHLGNIEEPINNDARICSSEVSDILPMFVNMLDAKSFMNLAMTCKGMYKRCMEDKIIKINVNENHVDVYSDEGGVGFSMRSSFVSEKNLRSYVATLRNQRFNLGVSEVRIDVVTTNTDIFIVNATRRYLKDVGVTSIKTLRIIGGFSDWEAIIPFIKEFNVRIVDVYGLSIPDPVLRSLLQLDLDYFDYDGPIPVDIFLEADSQIRKIALPGMENIEWDKFLQILSKIQSGNILRLTVNPRFTWGNDRTFNFDEENELPEQRPLIFKRSTNLYEEETEEYFFLHWHGGVTKWVMSYFDSEMQIGKCAPNEFPPILRKDEDVLKDLTKMVPRVSCFKRQFDAFMEKFTLIEPSFEGPLPTERPLYFKADQDCLWQLTEDDVLMGCVWIDTHATWRSFLNFPRAQFGYRALAKLMFNKHIQKTTTNFSEYDCEGLAEFDFWLEDYKKLDFDYSAPLPEERPLVFEKPASEDGGTKKSCVILFDDHLLHCEFSKNKVKIRRCEPSDRPPILIDAKAVKEILQKGISDKRGDALSFLIHSREPEKQGDVRIRVDHETFLSGFELFKTSPSKRNKQLPIIFERTQEIDGKVVEKRWFDNGRGLSKFVWQGGYASLSDSDGHEIPFESMKELFKKCVQILPIRESRLLEWMSGMFPDDSYTGIPMDLKQLENCLEEFETHPFDYHGPMPKDRPLAFVKKELHHVCNDQPANCGCSVVNYSAWFLTDGVNISYCTWNATAQRVEFNKCGKDLPSILKSRTYLEALLQKTEIQDERWYGSLADFIAYFEDYTKISLSHQGPLPKERPLLVEQNTIGNHFLLVDRGIQNHTRYLLYDDGRIIECKWNDDVSGAIIRTIHSFADRIPTVLMSVWQ